MAPSPETTMLFADALAVIETTGGAGVLAAGGAEAGSTGATVGVTGVVGALEGDAIGTSPLLTPVQTT